VFDEFEEEFGEDVFEGLGSVGLASAVLGTALYVLYKYLLSRCLVAGHGGYARLAFIAHVALTFIGGVSAVVHGAALLDYAGFVEYGSVVLVVLLMLNGVLMSYVGLGVLRVLQWGLALAAAVLVSVHVASVD